MENMKLINKEKYMQIKEIILYLFGLSFFYSFEISKILLGFMFVFILIDIFFYNSQYFCNLFIFIN